MKIFFSWIKNEEESNSIDPLKREDLKIFKLCVSQKESEVALAKIWVTADQKILDSEAIIGYEDEEDRYIPLFKGRPIGFPRRIGQNFAEIEFSAEPLNAKEQLQKLAEQLKILPYYDPLFLEPGDDNPVNVLEARQDLYYWDKCTGKLSFSNLFQGRKVINVSDDILADSLKITLGDFPYQSVQVDLRAEWVQQAYGEFNLFPKIAKKFPQSTFNTLTPKQLLQNWPQVGDKVGPANSRKQTGYRVCRSYLKPFTPSYTGSLNVYPTLTPEFKRIDHPQPIRLKRSWLKGELWLDWSYKQKRAEVLQFTLDHDFPLKGKIQPRQKKLKIQLQKIDPFLDQPSCSSFFKTSRGKEAVQHAIEIAKSLLAGMARCIHLEFKVSFEKGAYISLDDSIFLKNDLIPNGFIKAKVTAYRLEIDEQERAVWIKAAATLGGNPSLPLKEITVENYHEPKPIQGLIDPHLLKIEDFIKRVEVKGDAEEQVSHLLNRQKEEDFHLERELSEKPTIINLELLDLRTYDVLEHFIQAELTGGWSAIN